MKQGQRSAISNGGRELETRARDESLLLGGRFWGHPLPKTRGSEIFLKEKLNLDKVLNKNIFPLQKSRVVLPASLQPSRAIFALSVNRSFPKP